MAFGHTDVRKVAVAALVAERQRDDAGGVGLKREHREVHHQIDVVLGFARYPFGHFDVGQAALIRLAAGCSDLSFDGANRVEVLVDLVLIGTAELTAKIACVREHAIENAMAVDGLLGLVAIGEHLVGITEEALEHLSRVDLFGHRHRRRAPGDVGRVGAAVPGVAVPRLGASLASELERGESGLVADLVGHHLVDRDPTRMSLPSVLRGWAPVRNTEFDRAWSPGPSP